MRHSIILDFLDKRITENIYKKVREEEKKLSSDRFIAYYSHSSILYWFLIFLLFLIFTLCFGFFDKTILYISGAGAIGCFFIVLYHISYRCIVDDTGITARKFLFLEKQILWKDIKKVEIQEIQRYGKPLEKTAIFRNKQNKALYTCSYDLVGFNLIVKKAKSKARKH